MRIVSSNLAIHAQASSSVTEQRHLLLQTWHAGRATRLELSEENGTLSRQSSTVAVRSSPPPSPAVRVPAAGHGVTDAQADQARQDAADHLDKNAMIIERLWGRIHRFHIDAPRITPAPQAATKASVAPQPEKPLEGMALTVDTREIHQEQLSVAAAGTLITADGRTLNVSMVSQQAQTFEVDTHLRVTAGNVPVDPLVLTLPGATPGLDGGRTQVDINGDGTLDDIATLRQGNALVARDLNHDGVIQDGREILGPSSGNAYAELAALDEDGNGFVDAGDRAFAELMLWRPGERAMTLAAAGVGALAVANAAAAYSMKDATGTAQAQVRSSGVALMENGQPALLQQVDFIPRV